MKKIKITALILVAVIIVSIAGIFAGCGSKMKSFEGTYIGNSGSVMILYKDGTGQYQDGKSSSIEPAAWRIEDGKIIVYAEDLGYEIYADISTSTTSLLFQSDKSRWNDELFVKTN